MKPFERILWLWLPPLALVAMIAVDSWLFRRFLGRSYLDFYLANGALVSIFASLITLTKPELGKQPALISARPLEYLASHLGLIQLYSHILAKLCRELAASSENAQDKLRQVNNPLPFIPLFFELLAALVGVLFLLAAVVVWFVLVMPLQYFILLFAGAPARAALRSQTRTVARLVDRRLQIKDVPRQDGKDSPSPDDADEAAGWWDASMSATPVAMSNALAALMLLVLNWWAGEGGAERSLIGLLPSAWR